MWPSHLSSFAARLPSLPDLRSLAVQDSVLRAPRVRSLKSRGQTQTSRNDICRPGLRLQPPPTAIFWLAAVACSADSCSYASRSVTVVLPAAWWRVKQDMHEHGGRSRRGTGGACDINPEAGGPPCVSRCRKALKTCCRAHSRAVARLAGRVATRPRVSSLGELSLLCSFLDLLRDL